MGAKAKVVSAPLVDWQLAFNCGPHAQCLAPREALGWASELKDAAWKELPTTAPGPHHLVPHAQVDGVCLQPGEISLVLGWRARLQGFKVWQATLLQLERPHSAQLQVGNGEMGMQRCCED